MKEILSALITPFQQDGSIDFHALAQIISQQLQDGVDGFIVCGTTAEVPTLTKEEKIEILDFVIAQTKRRVPIWFGCGSNCTRNAIANCKEVEHKDIAGVLLVTPYYNRPSQEGIYTHFMEIAKHTSLHIMLYNIPSRTGCELEEETLLRLLEHTHNIVALKHASKRLDIVTHTLEKFPSFKIYSGEDGYFVEGFACGICGIVSVMSHIVLPTMKRFVEEGCLDAHVQDVLYACAYHVFLEASPAPLKYIMSQQQRSLNTLRLPMVSVSDKTAHTLDEWMTENDSLLQR